MNFPILSSLILLPAVGALFLFFTRSNKENNITVKYVALFTSLVNFFLSIYLWILFDQSTSEFQFVEDRVWIKDLINYKVGIDGISILFIILTTSELRANSCSSFTLLLLRSPGVSTRINSKFL